MNRIEVTWLPLVLGPAKQLVFTNVASCFGKQRYFHKPALADDKVNGRSCRTALFAEMTHSNKLTQKKATCLKRESPVELILKFSTPNASATGAVSHGVSGLDPVVVESAASIPARIWKCRSHKVFNNSVEYEPVIVSSF